MAESYPIMWMDHTYGHLGCCHFLALVKSAAVNIPVECSCGLAGVFVLVDWLVFLLSTLWVLCMESSLGTGGERDRRLLPGQAWLLRHLSPSQCLSASHLKHVFLRTCSLSALGTGCGHSGVVRWTLSE